MDSFGRLPAFPNRKLKEGYRNISYNIKWLKKQDFGA
jgi:hypothetical protein